MTLADWIMRVATNDPPGGRQAWARAMRSEYASLAGGKLSWALGCWTTLFGWRLRADAVYLAVMLTVTCVWAFNSDFEQTIAVYLGRFIPRHGWGTEMLQPYLAVMLLVSTALSAFRRDRVFVTAFVMVLLNQISAAQAYYDMRHTFPNAEDGPVHPYNSYYFVAVFAEIGICFVGATVGRWISSLWDKRARQSPASHFVLGSN